MKNGISIKAKASIISAWRKAHQWHGSTWHSSIEMASETVAAMAAIMVLPHMICHRYRDRGQVTRCHNRTVSCSAA